MPRRILVAFDGSPMAERALEHVCDVHHGADVTVIHVIDPVDSVLYAEASGPNAAREWIEAAETEADSICSAAESDAAASGMTVDTVTVFGSPAREIVRYAREHDTDQIVVGSHGRRGVSKLILGSVADRVIRESPIPVTVVR